MAAPDQLQRGGCKLVPLNSSVAPWEERPKGTRRRDAREGLGRPQNAPPGSPSRKNSLPNREERGQQTVSSCGVLQGLPYLQSPSVPHYTLPDATRVW